MYFCMILLNALWKFPFPDSDFASEMSCGWTKGEIWVQNVLASVSAELILSDRSKDHTFYRISSDMSNHSTWKRLLLDTLIWKVQFQINLPISMKITMKLKNIKDCWYLSKSAICTFSRRCQCKCWKSDSFRTQNKMSPEKGSQIKHDFLKFLWKL